MLGLLISNYDSSTDYGKFTLTNKSDFDRFLSSNLNNSKRFDLTVAPMPPIRTKSAPNHFSNLLENCVRHTLLCRISFLFYPIRVFALVSN